MRLFGKEEIQQWERLKTYHIKKALPSQAAYGQESSVFQNCKISYCGDYFESPSIQGALYSGQKAVRKYLSLQ